jgi:hypothetical protein
MSAFDDASDLVEHAEAALPRIREVYETSLKARTIDRSLLVEIKNFFENLRSALDFCARALFEQHGSSKKTKPRIYFPYATADQTREAFEKSGRIEVCIPGLTSSRPDLIRALMEMQHFGARGTSGCQRSWSLPTRTSISV